MQLTTDDVTIPFEAIEIGDTRRVEGVRTMTEADIVNFAGVTGDFSAHHLSKESGANGKYGRRIVQGNLVLDICEAYMAGANSKVIASYGHDNTRFIEPVFPGDTLTFEREIIDKEDHDADTGKLTQKYTVENQHGEVVCVDHHILLVEKRS
jgi:acyl dehydratase